MLNKRSGGNVGAKLLVMLLVLTLMVPSMTGFAEIKAVEETADEEVSVDITREEASEEPTESESLEKEEEPETVPTATGTHGTASWDIIDGVLTIHAGQLPDSGVAPWKAYANEITSVMVEEGVIAGTNTSGLFSSLNKAITMDVSNLDTTATKNMTQMFLYNSSLETLNATNLVTSSVTTLHMLFDCCYNLSEIQGLETWDTSGVTIMSNAFRDTHSLRNLSGIAKWDTRSLTDLNSTFYRAGVQSLDLSAWNVEKLKNLHYTFARSQLRTLNISGWNIKDPTFLSYTFERTSYLEALDLEGWDFRNIPTGYPRQSTFESANSIKELRLGKHFFFHENDSYKPYIRPTDIYTGKLQAVGDGTPEKPTGAVLTIEELRALYPEGGVNPVETYVWEKIKKPAQVPVEAETTFDEEVPETNDFQFVLKDRDDNVIEQVTNDGKSVLFQALSFNTEDTFTLTLSQVAGDNPDIIYDDSVYELRITVTLDGDYQASVEVYVDDEKVEGLPIFKNFSKVDSEPETPTEPEEPQIPTESEINYYLVIQKRLFDEAGQPIYEKPGNNFVIDLFGPSFPDGKRMSIFTYQDVVVEGILPGNYRVEVVDPGRYIVDAKDVNLSSDNPHSTITVTGRLPNPEKNILPRTGGGANMVVFFIGLLLIIVGILFIVRKPSHSQC